MPSHGPAAVYGLTVPASGEPVPATLLDLPVRIRVCMAALDPTAPPKPNWNGEIPPKPRATLKIIRVENDMDDEEEDSDDEDEQLRYLMQGSDSDEEEDSDDEPNGGPSDKSKAKSKTKSKKEIKAEQLAELIKSVNEENDEDDDENEDEEMVDAKPNGTKSKGKEKATSDDEEEEDDDDDSDDMPEAEEYVLCTLDTENIYQQPLDITIGENELVFFKVSGNHDIHLTGNYLVEDDEDSDDESYDLDPDQEELLLGDSDEEDDEISDGESDELDDIDEPRIKELESDDDGEEAPKLVEAVKKGKNNKRKAEAEPEGLDEMITKAEEKQTHTQTKKLKNNKGEAVPAEETKPALKNGTKGDKDKKVQFAKQLEQGPTGSASKEKAAAGKGSVKVVQGVTLDDRKIGTGRTVKNGDKIGVRYIGKFKDGKVFDSCKKGKPFQFTIGKGEVIKGWDVGVLGMSIGGERRLTVPPNMGYGSKTTGSIPPNSTLIFDIKLIEIK